MSISARLILFLMAGVAGVMLVAGYLILRQRETALQQAMRSELLAHALTLRIALEQDYLAERDTDAKELIDRLSENPKIYGVMLFDGEGRVVMLSDPLIADEARHPDRVREVISTGEPAEFVTHIGENEVFSIILPITVGVREYAAFEIAQPISFVKADLADARRDIVLTTLVLLIVAFLAVGLVTRYGLSRPVAELLRGAFAVGRGDLEYRVVVPGGRSEFSRLGQEFNRMADGLAEQRRAAAQEAEKRLALERELRHSERLVAVGRLAAGIAHEMGAPLNVIEARAEQLMVHSDLTLHARQRHLTIIRTQAEKIMRIVRQLLNLSAPFNLRRSPIDLAVLVKNVLELVETDAVRNGIEFDLESRNNVLVDADSGLIHQVMLNICINGIQAMPAGGTLRVEFLHEPLKQNDTLFNALIISDTGSGVPVDHLAEIFEPFYTTKEVGRGVGLGLTVSHRIVEEHGGWIDVCNNEDGGASFTIFLPACDPKSEALIKKAAGMSTYEQKRTSIDS